MTRNFKIFAAGLLISFLGSLPVGSLNLTASKLSISEGTHATLIFFWGVILVEVAIVWGILKGFYKLKVIRKNEVWFQVLGVILLVYLAIDNLLPIEFTNPELGVPSSGLPSIQKSPFMLGVLLSLANPLQIPFWAGWNGYLVRINLLNQSTRAVLSYVAGIGGGTLAGMTLFVLFGQYLVNLLGKNDYVFTTFLSLFYLGFACYLTFRVFKNKLKQLHSPYV